MTRVIEVRTPGRLHFGLSSFGGVGREFSGLGMMVDGAGVTLRISPAVSFAASGPHSERVEQFARHWAFHLPIALPASCLEVVEAPPDHVGLGVGTQLGLAVAAGLSEFSGVDWRDAVVLSQMSGRGQRSAIGTHGFLHGGLVFDGGKLPGEVLGRLETRLEVPTDWRFVLIRPGSTQGLAGQAETTVMSSLPPVPAKVTESLHAIITDEILPAVATGNYDPFSHALYKYGYQAGNCFAAEQGGPFASASIATLVKKLRELGFPGVGQSSWGPMVFVVTENQESANGLVAELLANSEYRDYQLTITHANNSGATVEDISLGHLH